uniref:Uncharacterized protein n=1 Tax=Panagrolaimus superbus TaxID=310955 RepID=A0A914YM96_9BILA
MKFTPVNDLICGDEGRCEPGFQCSRPMEFDGPYLCLQKIFLDHDFLFPFTTPSPPVTSTTASLPGVPSTEPAVVPASPVHHYLVVTLQKGSSTRPLFPISTSNNSTISCCSNRYSHFTSRHNPFSSHRC